MKLILLLISIAALMYGKSGQLDRRINEYRTFEQSLTILSEKQIVEKVNEYFNKMLSGNDIDIWGEKDYWTTPNEFVVKGIGDCEDFAIAKYITLRELGIPSNRLMLIIVSVDGMKEHHAVLGYKNLSNEIMILDNLSWKILSLSDRKDLKIILGINEKSQLNEHNQYELKYFKEVIRKISIGM